MEVTGRIIVDIPMVEGVSKAGNPWKKKEWVLETINTPYPRKVKFHLFGDRADNVHIEVGKVYTVTFEIDSREFNGRWYTDIAGLSAYEVPEGNVAPAPQQVFQQPQPFQQPQQPFQQATPGAMPGAMPDFTNSGDESDLPF